MTAKTPTAQGISNLLARAGFTRAGARGTEGFSTRKIKLGDGDVQVRHWFQTGGGTDAQYRAELGRYAKAITDAGYAAQIDDDGRKVLVSA